MTRVFCVLLACPIQVVAGTDICMYVCGYNAMTSLKSLENFIINKLKVEQVTIIVTSVT